MLEELVDLDEALLLLLPVDDALLSAEDDGLRLLLPEDAAPADVGDGSIDDDDGPADDAGPAVGGAISGAKIRPAPSGNTLRWTARNSASIRRSRSIRRCAIWLNAAAAAGRRDRFAC